MRFLSHTSTKKVRLKMKIAAVAALLVGSAAAFAPPSVSKTQVCVMCGKCVRDRERMRNGKRAHLLAFALVALPVRKRRALRWIGCARLVWRGTCILSGVLISVVGPFSWPRNRPGRLPPAIMSSSGIPLFLSFSLFVAWVHSYTILTLQHS